MNRVLSTHVCVNHRLTVAWLNRALQAGIPAVEVFCARQHLDYRNRSQIAELGHWFRDADLKLHSIHSPMYSDEIWGRSGPQSVITITEPVKSKRIPMVDEIKRALDIAEIIPFRYMVQHLGVGEEEFDERKIDAAFSALKERIRSTHVHDNNGEADKHLFPLVAEGGTVDWKKAMGLLSSRPNQYPLLLELREVEGMEFPLDKINEVFDKLEGLSDES